MVRLQLAFFSVPGVKFGSFKFLLRILTCLAILPALIYLSSPDHAYYVPGPGGGPARSSESASVESSPGLLRAREAFPLLDVAVDGIDRSSAIEPLEALMAAELRRQILTFASQTAPASHVTLCLLSTASEVQEVGLIHNLQTYGMTVAGDDPDGPCPDFRASLGNAPDLIAKLEAYQGAERIVVLGELRVSRVPGGLICSSSGGFDCAEPNRMTLSGKMYYLGESPVLPRESMIAVRNTTQALIQSLLWAILYVLILAEAIRFISAQAPGTQRVTLMSLRRRTVLYLATAFMSLTACGLVHLVWRQFPVGLDASWITFSGFLLVFGCITAMSLWYLGIYFALQFENVHNVRESRVFYPTMLGSAFLGFGLWIFLRAAYYHSIHFDPTRWPVQLLHLWLVPMYFAAVGVLAAWATRALAFPRLTARSPNHGSSGSRAEPGIQYAAVFWRIFGAFVLFLVGLFYFYWSTWSEWGSLIAFLVVTTIFGKFFNQIFQSEPAAPLVPRIPVILETPRQIRDLIELQAMDHYYWGRDALRLRRLLARTQAPGAQGATSVIYIYGPAGTGKHSLARGMLQPADEGHKLYILPPAERRVGDAYEGFMLGLPERIAEIGAWRSTNELRGRLNSDLEGLSADATRFPFLGFLLRMGAHASRGAFSISDDRAHLERYLYFIVKKYINHRLTLSRNPANFSSGPVYLIVRDAERLSDEEIQLLSKIAMEFSAEKLQLIVIENGQRTFLTRIRGGALQAPKELCIHIRGLSAEAVDHLYYEYFDLARSSYRLLRELKERSQAPDDGEQEPRYLPQAFLRGLSAIASDRFIQRPASRGANAGFVLAPGLTPESLPLPEDARNEAIGLLQRLNEMERAILDYAAALGYPIRFAELHAAIQAHGRLQISKSALLFALLRIEEKTRVLEEFEGFSLVTLQVDDGAAATGRVRLILGPGADSLRLRPFVRGRKFFVEHSRIGPSDLQRIRITADLRGEWEIQELRNEDNERPAYRLDQRRGKSGLPIDLNGTYQILAVDQYTFELSSAQPPYYRFKDSATRGLVISSLWTAREQLSRKRYMRELNSAIYHSIQLAWPVPRETPRLLNYRAVRHYCHGLDPDLNYSDVNERALLALESRRRAGDLRRAALLLSELSNLWREMSGAELFKRYRQPVYLFLNTFAWVLLVGRAPIIESYPALLGLLKKIASVADQKKFRRHNPLALAILHHTLSNASPLQSLWVTEETGGSIDALLHLHELTEVAARRTLRTFGKALSAENRCRIMRKFDVVLDAIEVGFWTAEAYKDAVKRTILQTASDPAPPINQVAFWKKDMAAANQVLKQTECLWQQMVEEIGDYKKILSGPDFHSPMERLKELQLRIELKRLEVDSVEVWGDWRNMLTSAQGGPLHILQSQAIGRRLESIIENQELYLRALDLLRFDDHHLSVYTYRLARLYLLRIEIYRRTAARCNTSAGPVALRPYVQRANRLIRNSLLINRRIGSDYGQDLCLHLRAELHLAYAEIFDFGSEKRLRMYLDALRLLNLSLASHVAGDRSRILRIVLSLHVLRRCKSTGLDKSTIWWASFHINMLEQRFFERLWPYVVELHRFKWAQWSGGGANSAPSELLDMVENPPEIRVFGWLKGVYLQLKDYRERLSENPEVASILDSFLIVFKGKYKRLRAGYRPLPAAPASQNRSPPQA